MAAVKSQPVAPELYAPAAVVVRDFDVGISSDWDAFLAVSERATPFHSTAWMRALQTTFKYQNRSLYVERAGQITGVLPLFLVSNWIVGRCLISSPFADYGGVCAQDEESADALVSRARDIAIAEKVDFLELRHKTGKARPDFYFRDLYVGFEAALATDPEAQLKRLPRDTRYMIRKGTKAGLEIRSGLDQLPEFYELFTLNWRRLGTPVPSREWLEVLAGEFQGTAELVTARSNGRPVAGVFSFAFCNTLFPHYSGASPDANDMAANNFIYWELMKGAIGRGIRRFDFGRSKKNTGAYHFKSAWNMTVDPLEYQVSMVRRHTPPNFSPTNPKFALAAKLWRKMPMKASTWLGPRIVGWFP
jgi:FemAB-related protein (PEP-CTERM system-associated)